MKNRTIALVTFGFGIALACTIFDGLENRVEGDAGDGGVGDGAAGDGNLLTGEQAGYLSVADGVAFCSNAFLCPNLANSVEFSIDVPVDVNNFSSCVDWVSGPLPADRNGHDLTAAQLQCIAKATSCTAAGACVWQEQLPMNDPRCNNKDASAAGTCGDDGGSVYLCTNNPGILHCANTYFAAGTSCNYDEGGLAYCSRKPCGTDQCLGDMLQYCGVDGLEFSESCALGGFTCGFDQTEGYNDCLTNGAAKRCTALAVNCQGTTVSLCDGTFITNFDCANYGGSCDQTAFPRCKRPSETCTAQDGDINVCTGSSLTLCVNGAKQSFDCASIGKTCAAASGGQSGHCM